MDMANDEQNQLAKNTAEFSSNTKQRNTCLIKKKKIL